MTRRPRRAEFVHHDVGDHGRVEARPIDNDERWGAHRGWRIDKPWFRRRYFGAWSCAPLEVADAASWS
jgi:hypothetical protein